MKKILLVLFIVFSFTLSGAEIVKKKSSNDTGFLKIKKDAPKVFIDCERCDIDYIKDNIAFVNYVVDTKAADVYILITSLRTGSRGRKYSIKFTGQKRFKGINDLLYYTSSTNDTDDIIRKGLVKKLKLGLLQYVKRTKMADYIDIIFKEKNSPKQIKDKWHNWLFNIGLSFSQGGEKYYKHQFLNYSFNASRVTDKNRINLRFNKIKSISEYTINEEKIKSQRNYTYLSGIYVWGISEHFSLGAMFHGGSSTYFNRKRLVKFAPAIEYDIFPYSAATTKIFRIEYAVGIEDVDYYEITIYDKEKETLFYQALETEFEIKQKWGDANINIDFNQYLHDLKKYSLEFSGDFSWRIVKGVSFYTYASYSLIHNQLYLPKGDLTTEEILLRTSSLETNYHYSISAGIKISFGSFYNNAVNPRFGY